MSMKKHALAPLGVEVDSFQRALPATVRAEAKPNVNAVLDEAMKLCKWKPHLDCSLIDRTQSKMNCCGV
jgi:hypothetical protein